MPTSNGLNRRSFLRNAKMTALVGAVGTSSLGTVAAVAADATMGGKYDFDTPYNRIGTDCVKWDRTDQDLYGKENIAVGHGHRGYGFPLRAGHHQSFGGPHEARELGLSGHATVALPKPSSIGTSGVTASTSIRI